MYKLLKHPLYHLLACVALLAAMQGTTLAADPPFRDFNKMGAYLLAAVKTKDIDAIMQAGPVADDTDEMKVKLVAHHRKNGASEEYINNLKLRMDNLKRSYPQSILVTKRRITREIDSVHIMANIRSINMRKVRFISAQIVNKVFLNNFHQGQLRIFASYRDKKISFLVPKIILFKDGWKMTSAPRLEKER